MSLAVHELITFRELQRRSDIAEIQHAANSEPAEPTQREKEHAAMARRLLVIEAEREAEKQT